MKKAARAGLLGAVAATAMLIPSVAGASTPNLKAQLLKVSDMPAGWIATTTNSSGGGLTCNGHSLPKGPINKGDKHAEVAFENGSSVPMFGEALEVGNAAKAFRTVRSMFQGCHTLTDDGGSSGVAKGPISTMSFPTMGMKSVAWQSTLSVQGLNVGLDLVVSQVTPKTDALFVMMDLGSPDVDQLHGFITKAVAKIR
jgi:hypothetical protein